MHRILALALLVSSCAAMNVHICEPLKPAGDVCMVNNVVRQEIARARENASCWTSGEQECCKLGQHTCCVEEQTFGEDLLDCRWFGRPKRNV